MLMPPFKRSLGGLGISSASGNVGVMQPAADDCCGHQAAGEGIHASGTRMKLHEMDAILHCSVVGNCLSSGELRRLMARHIAVKGLSDLEVHHTAVQMAGQKGEVSKALHKALDQRHAGAIRTFAVAKDEAALRECWKQAWAQGAIPGAYWAVLTHKSITAELRQMVFGEVHMLSHLMGAANRHELQRFVALEKENTELHDRLDREQWRRQELIEERDQLAAQLRQQAEQSGRQMAQYQAELKERSAPAYTSALVALHTQRRERAERLAQQAQEQLTLLQEQLERVQKHGRQLAEELAAAEAELQRLSAAESDLDRSADSSSAGEVLLSACKVLYVGGRLSSTPAIRDYVRRHGGEFLHHDGGLEDRKGLLDSLLPGASLVVFPVDCVDHDSVAKLKRLSERHQVPFVPLRSASLASFAATLRREFVRSTRDAVAPPQLCRRHG